MDKITQALKKILPAEHVAEVAQAVEELMSEQYAQLKGQFDAELDKAYEQLTDERKADEVIAEQGYQQAYQIVAAVMNRLDEQREEFERALEEGFEEAFDELGKEKAKNNNLEVEIYAEADKKLQEMKDLMINKLDQFLAEQEVEVYEAAKRDVLSDPRLMEQRVAVERMAEILSDYLSTDDIATVSSSKIEEAYKNIESLKAQMKILEAKNFNLSRVNNKLNEQVTEAQQIITEAHKVERRERTNKRTNASGRGQRVVKEDLIQEYASQPTNGSNNERDLTEGHDPLNDLLVLSGLAQS